MQVSRLLIALSLLAAQSAMAADTLTGTYRGDGRACFGALFVRRPAIDYYWQSRVRAHGTVDAQLDAILTDRAGETIGCFRWSIVVDVTAP